MRRHCIVGIASLVSALWASSAFATTITFDEMPATNNGVALSGPYASTGATFSASNAGTWIGLSGGDPGNWQVNGTNGPQFLGFNGTNSNGGYSETVGFASAISTFSADFSRTNGSTDELLTLSAFSGATLVSTTTASLGDLNSWSTLSVSGSDITSVSWSGTGTGYHPFAADNLNFDISAVPLPASAPMFGVALLALGAVGYGMKRKTNAAV